nr:MAG TPA_asm: hypothetical protein [Caudoviricetes sp.]
MDKVYPHGIWTQLASNISPINSVFILCIVFVGVTQFFGSPSNVVGVGQVVWPV